MLLLRVKQLKSAEYKNIACVENIFVQSFSFGSTCFYERLSLKWETTIKQQFRNFLKCKEIDSLKTETFLRLKETFTWSKIYRVVDHSVNMGVVEIQAGNFPEKEQLFRKFRATCGMAIHP